MMKLRSKLLCNYIHPCYFLVLLTKKVDIWNHHIKMKLSSKFLWNYIHLCCWYKTLSMSHFTGEESVSQMFSYDCKRKIKVSCNVSRPYSNRHDCIRHNGIFERICIKTSLQDHERHEKCLIYPTWIIFMLTTYKLLGDPMIWIEVAENPAQINDRYNY